MSETYEPQAARPLMWFKSSYSSGEGGECVEVATGAAGVHVRDSKVATGPVLTVSPTSWAGFVALVAEPTV